MTDVLFWLLMAVDAIAVASLIAAPRRRALGSVANTLADPIVLLAIVLGFFLCDFAILKLDGRITLFEKPVIVSSSDIVEAFAAVSAMIVATAIATHVALVRAGALPNAHANGAGTPQPPTVAHRMVSAALLGLAMLGGAIVLRELIASLSLVLSGRLNKQQFFLSNQLLLALMALVIPAFAVFVSSRRAASMKVVLTALLIATLVTIAGSRSLVLVVGLIVVVALVRDRVRPPAWLYSVVIPVGALGLALMRYVFRESFKYDSFGAFIEDRGGLFQLFFRSSEVGLAEGFVSVWMNLDSLARPPFEGFFGALVYPVPRTLLSIKPLSGSGFLTSSLSPSHWDATRSEILSSGFGDLLMQFGPVLAVVISFVLAYAFVAGATAACRLGGPASVIGLPFVIWWELLFMRTSVFHLGSSMWPFCLVVGSYFLGVRLLGRSATGASTTAASVTLRGAVPP